MLFYLGENQDIYTLATTTTTTSINIILECFASHHVRRVIKRREETQAGTEYTHSHNVIIIIIDFKQIVIQTLFAEIVCKLHWEISNDFFS